MKCKLRQLSIVVLMVSVLSVVAQAGSFWTDTYCVPVDRLNLNPRHNIDDGKEMALDLFFKSYISTDSDESGILEKFEFSPDGKSFVGQLTKDLKWSDGSPVTPLEAAKGITETLPFRALGSRVKVNKSLGSPAGITIINERTFKIVFETDISNPTGVIREALSTNSRGNRFWLYKTGKNSEPLVLARHPIATQGAEFGFLVGDRKIRVTDRRHCKSPDYSMFADDLEGDLTAYKTSRSRFPGSLTVEMNTSRLSQGERAALIVWLREAFASYGEPYGIMPARTLFEEGEPGHSEASEWPEKTIHRLSRSKKIVIAYEMPFSKPILEKAASKSGLKIDLVKFPFSRSDVDAQLIGSTIKNGRHLIFQDLEWPHTREFLKGAPKSLSTLEAIARKSASTVPADNETLQNFEKAAIEEQSWAPVARKFPTAYTKSGSANCLKWTKQGELAFGSTEECSLPGKSK